MNKTDYPDVKGWRSFSDNERIIYYTLGENVLLNLVETAFRYSCIHADIKKILYSDKKFIEINDCYGESICNEIIEDIALNKDPNDVKINQPLSYKYIQKILMDQNKRGLLKKF